MHPCAETLCESCGYAVVGLTPDRACPECATPVAESLPARRAGSAWQRATARARVAGASVLARALHAVPPLVRTHGEIMLRPRASFRVMTIEREASALLRWITLVLASVLAALPGLWMHPLAEFADRAADLLIAPLDVYVSRLMALPALLRVVLFAATCVVSFETLTRVEELGLRFFGSRRRWRVSPAVAYAVCSHATGGWLLGGALALASGALVAAWGAFLPPARFGHHSALQWLTAFGPIGSLLVGMVAFEVLVYFGVRECRFANPPPTGDA